MPMMIATDESYEDLVRQPGPVVAVFFRNGERCYPRIRRAVEDVGRGEMPFIMVNIEHCREVQNRWWVVGSPCFRFFRDGLFVAEHLGSFGYEKDDTDEVIRGKIEKWLAEQMG